MICKYCSRCFLPHSVFLTLLWGCHPWLQFTDKKTDISTELTRDGGPVKSAWLTRKFLIFPQQTAFRRCRPVLIMSLFWLFCAPFWASRCDFSDSYNYVALTALFQPSSLGPYKKAFIFPISYHLVLLLQGPEILAAFFLDSWVGCEPKRCKAASGIPVVLVHSVCLSWNFILLLYFLPPHPLYFLTLVLHCFGNSRGPENRALQKDKPP